MNNPIWNARTLRGLLWYEKRRNGSFLSWIVAAWLAGIWILCLFNHPGFIIAFGVIYAAAAGLRFGGLETVEGSSEFTYTLPPTRIQRCFFALLLGLGSVIALTLLGNVALSFNLPQAFWRLFVSSGFTEPYEPANTAFLRWCAALMPAAVFAAAFAIASFAKTRARALASPLGGIIFVCAGVTFANHLESRYWQHANGVITILMLLVFSILALFLACHFFFTKEQIGQPKQLQGNLGLLGIVIAALAILLFLSLIFPLVQ